MKAVDWIRDFRTIYKSHIRHTLKEVRSSFKGGADFWSRFHFLMRNGSEDCWRKSKVWMNTLDLCLESKRWRAICIPFFFRMDRKGFTSKVLCFWCAHLVRLTLSCIKIFWLELLPEGRKCKQRSIIFNSIMGKTRLSWRFLTNLAFGCRYNASPKSRRKQMESIPNLFSGNRNVIDMSLGKNLPFPSGYLF